MSFTRTHLRGVLRRPSRLALTGLAIAVAALFAMGAVVARDITGATFLAAVTDIPVGTTVVVDPSGDPIALLAKVRATKGVDEATGRLAARTSIGGNAVTLVADPGSGPLSRVRLVDGAYPKTSGEIASSSRLGLAVGTRTELGVVTGVVDAPSADGKAVYTTDVAALALVHTDLTRIDVRGADTAALVEALDAATTPTTPADEARDKALASARGSADQLFAVLSAFVLIAGLAALMVATSTFRIVFAQRTRQLALLRAVGAPRRKLVRALVAEGALTGFVAGLVGSAAAVGVGYLVPLVVDVSAPSWSPVAMPAVVLVSVLVTVVAALVPARSAAGVSPLEALRTAGSPRESGTTTAVRVGVGVVLLVAAGFVISSMFSNGLTDTYRPGGKTEELLLSTVASGALTFGALLALGPLLMGPVLRALGAVPLGVVGRIAVRGIGGAPRRAAAVSAVVALGAGLLTGVLVSGDTIRGYLKADLAASYPSDFQVTGKESVPLPAGVVDALRNRSELKQVLAFRALRMDVETSPGRSNVMVSDVDFRALPTASELVATSGSTADLGPGKVVFTKTYARIDKVRVGDEITIAGRRLTVVALIEGESIGGAGVLVDPADLDRFGGTMPTGALIAAQDSGNLLAAHNAVRAVAGEGLTVSVLADRRNDVGDVVDLLLALAAAMLGLTLLISIVGVGTTAALSVVERTKESGVLRAIGFSRFALGSTTVAESALYGVLGGLFGLVIGIPHAWMSVLALGVDTPLTVPVPLLTLMTAGLVVLTALSGLLPARKAAKASPVTAMRVE